MENINIRQAEKEDSKTIAIFQILMARETESIELNPIMVLMGVNRVFIEPSKGRYFVVENQGEIIASLLVTFEWSDWRASEVWWIQSVFILEGFRKQGVFGAMYRYLKNEVLSRDDVAGLRLYVDKKNLGAIEVYKKAGMTNRHYDLFEWMKE